MSSMLDQAIIDAEALKEAAIKNAESAIIDKYSADIKEAVEKLLEQPEDMGMGLEDPAAEEEPGFLDKQVPAAATDGEKLCPCPANEDEVWEFSLDDIAHGLKAQDTIDASELIDPLQFAEDELGMDSEEDIELELQESTLLDLIQDSLLDTLNEEEEEDEEEDEDEDEEEDEEDRPKGRLSGAELQKLKQQKQKQKQNESLIRENKQLLGATKTNKQKIKALKEQNNKYRTLVEKIKERLNEVNLSNAKLLYMNRILENNSLNERQKDIIVEKLSNVDSVEEARTIFETLQSAVGSALNKKAPKSLNEVVRNGSSAFLPRKEEKQSYSFKNRMQILAGIDLNK
jgi:hypothetical protein